MAQEFFRSYYLIFFFMSTIDYIMGGLLLLLLAWASPFVYEQATGEPPRADAAYWAARGYAPLPQAGAEKEGGAK